MSGEDRRRHPRINIRDEIEKAQALKGAEIEVEGSDKALKVFDMSVSGLACEKLENVKEKSIFKAKIRLGELEPQDVSVEVVWSSEKVTGLRFESCEANVKLSIGDFLQDRIVGQYMISVDPKYFADHVDFQVWYHGPNNTNVFIWKVDGKEDVAKVMVAFDGTSLIFEEGEFRAGGDSIDWQEYANYSVEALPKAEEADDEDLPVVLDNESPLVKRSIEILSQVAFDKEVLQKLIRQMEAV